MCLFFEPDLSPELVFQQAATTIPICSLEISHSSVSLSDLFSAIFPLHLYPTSLPPSLYNWKKGLNPRAKV